MFKQFRTFTARRWSLRAFASLATVVVTAGVGSVTQGAIAPTAVSSVPVSYTPWLLSSTPDQYVFEIDQCGGLMYAVGRVSAIGQGSSTFSRGNAFSFSATNGTM